MQQETEKLEIWLQRSWVLYVQKTAGLGGIMACDRENNMLL
jgi:hypothetical protein